MISRLEDYFSISMKGLWKTKNKNKKLCILKQLHLDFNLNLSGGIYFGLPNITWVCKTCGL